MRDPPKPVWLLLDLFVIEQLVIRLVLGEILFDGTGNLIGTPGACR